MPYQLKESEPTGRGLRRIAREELESALASLDALQAARTARQRDPATHDVRKRMKKLRAVVRLLRGVLPKDQRAQEIATFRDVGRALSAARDAAVRVRTLDTTRKQFADSTDKHDFSHLRKWLAQEARAIARGTRSGEAAEAIQASRPSLQAALDRLPQWPVSDDAGFEAVEEGLRASYRQARKAFKAAAESREDEVWHDWRKRAKDFWYHLQLLRRVWPGPMEALTAEADRLCELLGGDHDLSVLHHDVRHAPEKVAADTPPEDRKALLSLLRKRQHKLRRDAERLGALLFLEKPKVFVERIRAYDSLKKP